MEQISFSYQSDPHRSVAVEAANRKLIRPSLNELKEKAVEAKRGPIQPPTMKVKPPLQQQAKQGGGAPSGPPKVQGGGPPQQQGPPKPTAPPEQTNAENFYYAKQISNKTPMVFVLRGGEKLQGVIEWYDKWCLRIAREQDPAVLVYKHNIRHMYKHD
ncbi:MAG: RNA chaperone Hfq [Bryobacteraceae bacterium]